VSTALVEAALHHCVVATPRWGSYARSPHDRRGLPQLVEDEAALDEMTPCGVDERCIYFVTGNAKKEQEVNLILSDQDLRPFRVEHVDLDLPELQGEPLDIAREKCRCAAQRVQASVIVEDTSLCFNALNGMPGPYIKWFVSAVGNDGLFDLLAGKEDKTAYCQCTLAFSPGPGAEPLVFVGRTDGRVVPPEGEGGFGWDAIFVPNGMEMPFGAMPIETKNQISHRARALQKFVAHCKHNEDAIMELISTWS